MHFSFVLPICLLPRKFQNASCRIDRLRWRCFLRRTQARKAFFLYSTLFAVWILLPILRPISLYIVRVLYKRLRAYFTYLHVVTLPRLYVTSTLKYLTTVSFWFTYFFHVVISDDERNRASQQNSPYFAHCAPSLNFWMKCLIMHL